MTSADTGGAPATRSTSRTRRSSGSRVPATPPADARPPMDPATLRELTDALRERMGSVVVGKTAAIDTLLATFLAGGHLLIEDVPGVAKTTLALALARCLDLSSARIQFTADLLPADVTGVSVYDQSTREFRFHPGPVFAGVVVADEINRATPRTQSALLEAMGEGQVSVEGRSLPLPDPFIVVATQNPLEMEGTFALPEAQRDRFMTRMAMGYPDADAEAAMLLARSAADPLTGITPIASEHDARAARATVAALHLDSAVARYIVTLASATRSDEAVALGASPRAGLHLAAVARARAAMAGRGFVSPDDVAHAGVDVLAHRLIPAGHHASAADALAAATRALRRIIANTPVPTGD